MQNTFYLVQVTFLLTTPTNVFSALSGISWVSSTKKSFRPWGARSKSIHNRRNFHEKELFNSTIDNSIDDINTKYSTVSQDSVIDGRGVEVSIDNNSNIIHHDHNNINQHHRRPLKLIIMGGPASGKGTQCQRLAAEYGLVHLSTGDMLREAVRQESDIGLAAKEYMENGELVPDEIMIRIVIERLKKDDCQKQGWLLDGFPRTSNQSKALIQNGVIADKFIFLNVPDRIMIDRVVGRRIDPLTNKVYHMTYSPPTDNLVTRRLIQRSDDTVEKISNRLQQFHTNADAVRKNFKEVEIDVDGTGAPESIFDHIKGQLDVAMNRDSSFYRNVRRKILSILAGRGRRSNISVQTE